MHVVQPEKAAFQHITSGLQAPQLLLMRPADSLVSSFQLLQELRHEPTMDRHVSNGHWSSLPDKNMDALHCLTHMCIMKDAQAQEHSMLASQVESS